MNSSNDGGTYGMEVVGSSTNTGFVRYAVTSDHISIGFWHKTSASNSNTMYFYRWYNTPQSVAMLRIYLYGNGGSPYYRIRWEGGFDEYTIPVSVSTQYWTTIEAYTGGNTSRVRIYDAAGSIVQNSNSEDDSVGTVTTTGGAYHDFGFCDDADGDTQEFDDIVFDTTDATFPLAP